MKLYTLLLLATITFGCDYEQFATAQITSTETYKGVRIAKVKTIEPSPDKIMYVVLNEGEEVNIGDQIRMNGRTRNHFKEDLVK